MCPSQPLLRPNDLKLYEKPASSKALPSPSIPWDMVILTRHVGAVYYHHTTPATLGFVRSDLILFFSLRFLSVS
jgi:hypothetical protein